MFIVKVEIADVGQARAKSPVLGVLGGMGPAATADFLDKLTKLTPADRDQDHIPVVICSFPQIPDRTEAILNSGPSPLPAMRNALAMLERCGVSRVAMPCSTAHYWFDELQEQTSLPIVHMVDAVACALQEGGLAGGAVGLLATTATIRAGVYANRLNKLGFHCLLPDDSDQAKLMSVIRAVKAGRTHDERNSDSIRRVADGLFESGARSVILACTELPLLLPAWDAREFLDATAALARACVYQAKIQKVSAMS
jgi:aspartate racemase